MIQGGLMMVKIKNKIEIYGVIRISIIFFCIFLILGGILGIVFSSSYYEILRQSVNYFSSYIIQNQGLEISFLFTSIWQILKNIGILYLISFTSYCIPIIAAFIAYQGICVGLLIVSLVKVYSWNGLLLSIMYYFPQSIFVALAYLLSIKFSYQNYLHDFKYERGKKIQAWKGKTVISIILFVVVGKILEMYANYPILRQWFLGTK